MLSYWLNIATPILDYQLNYFLGIERKVNFGQISHISYYLHIALKAINPMQQTSSIS